MTERDLLSGLARLLAYPSAENDVEHLRCALRIHQPACLPGFERFVEGMDALSFSDREECYTRTFDLNPSCAPYLSVHLFGEESFKRSQLMAGLKVRYADMGFDSGTELPDHIALVLQAAPGFAPDEWADLKHHCLAPALAKMKEALAADNPYRHLFDVVSALIEAEELLEIVHA